MTLGLILSIIILYSLGVFLADALVAEMNLVSRLRSDTEMPTWARILVCVIWPLICIVGGFISIFGFIHGLGKK